VTVIGSPYAWAVPTGAGKIVGTTEVESTSAGRRERAALTIAVASALEKHGRTAAARAPSLAAFCTSV